MSKRLNEMWNRLYELDSRYGSVDAWVLIRRFYPDMTSNEYKQLKDIYDRTFSF